jgi:hypothetical protein
VGDWLRCSYYDSCILSEHLIILALTNFHDYLVWKTCWKCFLFWHSVRREGHSTVVVWLAFWISRMFTARVTEFCLTLFATGIVRYYIILCFAFGRFFFNMYFLIGTSLLLLLGWKDMFLHVSEINHILSNLVSWQQADIIRCTFLIINGRLSKCWFPHTWKELTANGVPSQEPYASRMLPACTLYGPKAKNPLHGKQAK